MARDKTKVLAGRPWTFDQNLVMLNDIDGFQQPSNISMTCCPFWIRLYNLPLGYRYAKHIELVAGSIGEVVEVDTDGVVWDTSARVRVIVDISKPLCRVPTISMNNGRHAMFEVKYERLPTFCYKCGIIGHIERDCLLDEEDEGTEDKQWGSWLRASPRQGRQKMEEEAKAFPSCARVIHFESPDRLRGVEKSSLEVAANNDEAGRFLRGLGTVTSESPWRMGAESLPSKFFQGYKSFSSKGGKGQKRSPKKHYSHNQITMKTGWTYKRRARPYGRRR